MRAHITRGAVAGALAGAAGSVYMLVLSEPLVSRAIALEHDADAGHHHGDELVISRTAQVVGGLVTLVVVGVVLGVVFSVLLARLADHLPGDGTTAKAAVLTACGIGVLVLLPAVKVPANPPGVGQPSSLEERTLIYVLVLCLGLLWCTVVALLRRSLPRTGPWGPYRGVLLLMLPAAVGLALLALTPTAQQAAPPGYPADLLWSFRVHSVGQLTLAQLVWCAAYTYLHTAAEVRSSAFVRR